jgi:hypothetical protein
MRIMKAKHSFTTSSALALAALALLAAAASAQAPPGTLAAPAADVTVSNGNSTAMTGGRGGPLANGHAKAAPANGNPTSAWPEGMAGVWTGVHLPGSKLFEGMECVS